jgi:hypothetical protein
MKANIETWCRELGAEVVTRDGNVYATKGKAKTYPCVVAHMDTVHSIIPNKHFIVYYDNKLDALWAKNTDTGEQTGVGGDDKVGIFLALEQLAAFDNIKCVFFRDEEVGCLGSNLAYMKFFKDVSFVLQGDRRGIGDFVNRISGNKLYDDKFSDAIKPILKEHNRKETHGGMTDVSALVNGGIEVCVANASCGYYEPHSKWEFVTVTEAFDTSDMFSSIIRTLHKDGERWLCERAKKQKYVNNYNRGGRYDAWEDNHYGQGGMEVTRYQHGQIYDRDNNKWVDKPKDLVTTKPDTIGLGYEWEYDTDRKGYIKKYYFVSDIPLDAKYLSIKGRNMSDNLILADSKTSKKVKKKITEERRKRKINGWNMWKPNSTDASLGLSCHTYGEMFAETREDRKKKLITDEHKRMYTNNKEWSVDDEGLCSTCGQNLVFDESVYNHWCHNCMEYMEIQI